MGYKLNPFNSVKDLFCWHSKYRGRIVLSNNNNHNYSIIIILMIAIINIIKDPEVDLRQP